MGPNDIDGVVTKPAVQIQILKIRIGDLGGASAVDGCTRQGNGIVTCKTLVVNI